jgi:hypothetical protein
MEAHTAMAGPPFGVPGGLGVGDDDDEVAGGDGGRWFHPMLKHSRSEIFFSRAMPGPFVGMHPSGIEAAASLDLP